MTNEQTSITIGNETRSNETLSTYAHTRTHTNIQVYIFVRAFVLRSFFNARLLNNKSVCGPENINITELCNACGNERSC